MRSSQSHRLRCRPQPAAKSLHQDDRSLRFPRRGAFRLPDGTQSHAVETERLGGDPSSRSSGDWRYRAPQSLTSRRRHHPQLHPHATHRRPRIGKHDLECSTRVQVCKALSSSEAGRDAETGRATGVGESSLSPGRARQWSCSCVHRASRPHVAVLGASPTSGVSVDRVRDPNATCQERSSSSDTGQPVLTATATPSVAPSSPSSPQAPTPSSSTSGVLDVPAAETLTRLRGPLPPRPSSCSSPATSPRNAGARFLHCDGARVIVVSRCLELRRLPDRPCEG